MFYLIFFFFGCAFYFFSGMTNYNFSFRYYLFYALFAFCFFIFIHKYKIVDNIKSKINKKKYDDFFNYLYSSHFNFAENHTLQISHNVAPFYDSDFLYNNNLVFLFVHKNNLGSILNQLQEFYKNLAKDQLIYWDKPDNLTLENYYKTYNKIFSFKNKSLNHLILMKIYNPNDDLIRIGLLML
ncbi:MAG: hypothetical protein ACRC8F_00040 [Cetobacterium sp.]